VSPPLADRLRASEPLSGLFVKMPCAVQLEAAGRTGFDLAIVDTEHGPADAHALEDHLRAASAVAMPVLVRVPALDPVAIGAALDAGAAGVVVPHVRDADEACAAVAAARYPPRGGRGLALSTRAAGYGTVPLAEHLRAAEAETVVIVQVEDAEAVARADEIAATDGIDGVLIGVTDLSISLGHPGEPEHPRVAGAIERILAAALAVSVAVAVVVSDTDHARRWRGRGASLTVFVAVRLLSEALASAAAGTRAPEPSAAARAGDQLSSSALLREPLVLLPGTLGTWRLWEQVATALGEQAAPRLGRIDLDDSVDEMAESVLAAAPSRFALAGHSQGAIVALEIVRRAPERVSRLALLNASARPASEQQLAVWARTEQRLSAGEFAEVVAEFARAGIPAKRHADGELIATIEGMAEAVGPAGLARQLAAQRTRPDSRSSLRAISCPALVISGAEDQVCPPALQDELVEAIPGAVLERIGGCGHYSPLEVPARVAHAMGRWLAGTDAG
jgi:4-hydroxy-2-oxoheptanedioate aldolase